MDSILNPSKKYNKFVAAIFADYIRVGPTL